MQSQVSIVTSALIGASVLCAGLASAATSESKVTVQMLEDSDLNRRVSFDFPDPYLKSVRINGETWKLPVLAEESMAVEAGMPALPDVRRSIQIGGDDAVSARLVDGSYYDIPNVQIAPGKGAITRDVNPSTVPYTFGPVYDSDGFWPANTVSIDQPHIMRNVRGVTLTVHPLQWNPATKTLRVWTDMVVDVPTTGKATDNILHRSSIELHSDNAAWETLYQRHFINYPEARRYDPLDNSGGMLIICHDPWLSNIQPLADHKNGIGIQTDVVGISQVGNSPASIEAYIDAMYGEADLCYVLLVGDAQHISAYTSADNGLSDPIYAKMTADHYPDIFVGRFSAESAADVDTQVQRTIAYENDAWTQKPEYLRALGIASNQGPGDDGETDDQHMEHILNQLSEYGYTYTQGEYDPSGSVSDAVAAINQGIGTIAYCGHGSETCFGNGAPICINDVNNLTNTEMLPWIVSVACVNGAYASGTCFAESWLRATHGGEPSGAIGIYASTINQYWSEPMCGEDEIYDCYTAEEYTTLGVLFYAGSCQMMEEYGQTGIDMYDTWHLFGDPSLVVVGTAAPPTGMRVGGTGFAAEGPLGGPFLPDSSVFTLTNYEDYPINFNVSGATAWVDVSPTSGFIPVGGEITVTAVLNAAASSLPNGLHTCTLSFVNENTNDGNANKGLSVNVGTPVPVISWTFDEDPGWAAEGDWAFGTPTGQGGASYGNPDPVGGATGNNAYGVNLNGDYSLNVGSMNLTSEAIDCSTYTETSVSFQRWLNCDYQSYVINTFQVSNNGTSWTTLWENPGTGETADSSWNLQEYDISSVADGQSAVYLRWTHEVNDFAWAYSGWNIDDVTLSAVDSSISEPCLGDTDNSGAVDTTDILFALGNYGCTSNCGAADVDGDGSVTTSDILAMLGNWGNCQ